MDYKVGEHLERSNRPFLLVTSALGMGADAVEERALPSITFIFLPFSPIAHGRQYLGELRRQTDERRKGRKEGGRSVRPSIPSSLYRESGKGMQILLSRARQNN